MNSFIPWVGGKSKLLWIINKMAPDHYSRFIDVFGGSGTVTMSRPIQQGCMEVYNDFNSNLTNLFCCVKNRPLALLAELGFLPLNTRDDFNVLYKFLSKGEITDDYLQEEMELTEIPPHQFLFNAGSIDKRSYMEMLQLDEAEYNLIKFPQRGVCLYKCGNERYLLEVHAPAYKEKLFGTAGGR